jgi:hypothetical protein
MRDLLEVVPSSSLEGFMLRKEQEYPDGCFNPREDMKSYRAGTIKKSGGSLSPAHKSGGKTPSRMRVQRS